MEYCQTINDFKILIMSTIHQLPGARGSLVVMALRYKPAGRGFDSR